MAAPCWFLFQFVVLRNCHASEAYLVQILHSCVNIMVHAAESKILSLHLCSIVQPYFTGAWCTSAYQHLVTEVLLIVAWW